MTRTLADLLASRRAPAADALVEKLPKGALRCFACGHRCKILPGLDGICRVRSNVGGTLMVPRGYTAGIQVDPIEKKPFFHVLPGNDALSFGMLGCDLHCGYCFPGEVRVATNEGMRRLDELFSESEEDGEDESSRRAPPALRAIADDGKESRVLRVFRHRHEGELVRIATRFLPGFEATPDHPVLATEHPGEAPPRFLPAGQVRAGFYLALPRRERPSRAASGSLDVTAILRRRLGAYRRRRRVAVETVEEVMALTGAGLSSSEIARKAGLRADSVRHFRSRVRRGGAAVFSPENGEILVEESGRVRFGQERRPGIPSRIAVDEKLARLLGLYCAEGCVVESKTRPNSRTVVFAFGLREEALARETRSLLRDVFGVEARETDRSTTRAVATGKSSVGVVLGELCGRGAARKRVPALLGGARREVVLAFLEGLVAGDGHRYEGGKVSLTTVSEDLAWGVVQLLIGLGRLPSLYVAERPERGKILGREVRQAARQVTVVWRERETKRRLWREDQAYRYVPVRAVTRRPFAGWVYNLETDGRHTYLANGLAVHNCQNWVTSQALRDPAALAGPQDVGAPELVSLAEREGAPVVVSTYNEPLITAEWAVEVMKLAHERGLLSGFVSNGNATEQVLDFLRPYVSLYKIDLKSFDDKQYRSLGAPLEHILEGIRLVHRKGFWLEVVTLVVPGFNDSEAELREMARFLRSVSPDIPWHVTGFHDDYKMGSQGDTPARTIVRGAEIGAEEGLHFVYAGNRPGRVGEWENTRCPACRSTLIRRQSFRVLEQRIGPGGLCPDCGRRIPGVFAHPRARPRAASAPAVPRRVR